MNPLWRRGPDWLYADVPHTDPEPTCMPEECAVELKGTALRLLNLMTTDSQGSIDKVMNCEKFSTLSKLLRVTSYMVRAVRRFKNSKEDVPANLTPDELAYAEMLWIKSSQLQLASQKDFTVQQKQFNLFVDEKGIWRCGGQLSNFEAPYATKHPVLLPRNHPLTTVVVRNAHGHVRHNGVKETLTETRRIFWIPKGRSLVRYLIHHCILCRRFEEVPLRVRLHYLYLPSV